MSQPEALYSFMVGTMEERAWMRQGACAGSKTSVFYPDDEDHANAVRVENAKRICNGDADHAPCPVRETCLEWAITHKEKIGVWGGASERERVRIRRRRQKDARAKRLAG